MRPLVPSPRRGPLIALAGLALLATAPAADELAEGRLTHLSVLRALAREAIGEMLESVPVSEGDVLTVVPATVSSGNAVVGDELAAALSARGVRVSILDRPLPGATGGTEVPAASPTAPGDTAGALADTSAGASGGSGLSDLVGSQPPADPAADPADPAAEPADPAQDPADPADDPAPADPEASHDDEVGVDASPLPDADATSGDTDAVPTDVATPTGPASPTIVGQRLVYRVDEWRVQYVDESRTFFLGPRRVDRAVAVDLTARLVDSDGETVLAVGRGDAIHLDRLSKGRLSLYESQGVTATELEKPGARRVIEPVVVGGIVASLVYLFYTNQN
jgi:hypothetical protein